ncbi:hypothetical protein [Palleronia sp. THAF1]|nr:hypothetical protein [Palleronia sp. THAF1]
MPTHIFLLILVSVIAAAGLTVWGVTAIGWPIAAVLPATLVAALLMRRL